ncbi:unnamed protein product [Brachionus calyciflorus]|uniref:Uncharacterized protein n=1 Tax=Brachionus calyciflorus TaxID=104777 RepID=A0A813SQP7_9BILA|nr:unnamed protein product [Brachionus calyciflorus]
MGKLKNRLLFVGLSISAYASPIFMIISILTHYWLNSMEKIQQQQQGLKDKTQTTTSIQMFVDYNNKNNKTNDFTQNLYYAPLDYIQASYGLWKMCRISDTSMQQRCEYIKYFQNSDSETRITDTLKKQIGVCILPIFIAMFIMLIAVLLHTYSYIRKKLNYLYLLSGCLFIFAGLASLTALIVFIAAVNGAVDNKLTLNKSKEEEPPFDYSYGFSFFCAVLSFLSQEFNGICNIYWYIEYYRKYKHKTESSEKFIMPQIIKLNELAPEKKPEIRIINESDYIVKTEKPLKRPTTNKIHKIKHQNYKNSFKKSKNLQPPKSVLTESSITESSHHGTTSSTSNLTESSSSSESSEYQTKVNTLSNRHLDENELKFKFYKLDKEMLPIEPRNITTQRQKQTNFNTQRTLSKSPPHSNKVRIQTSKNEYKIQLNDYQLNNTTRTLNRAQRIRLNRPLIQKNKSLNDTYPLRSCIYDVNNPSKDYQNYVVIPNEEYYYNFNNKSTNMVNLVNQQCPTPNRRVFIQKPFMTFSNVNDFGHKCQQQFKVNVPYNVNQQAQSSIVVHKKRKLKRTTSV